MIKNIKPGDTIRCIVEKLTSNCILVRFEYHDGKANGRAFFKGVLVDANRPCTKREPRLQLEDLKPQLTEEITKSFVEVFNATHISGKHLRNKHKPSCLILDDYRHDGGSSSLSSSGLLDRRKSSCAENSISVNGEKPQGNPSSKKKINKQDLKIIPSEHSVAQAKVAKKTFVTSETRSRSEFPRRKIGHNCEDQSTEKKLQKPVNFFGKSLLDSCELYETSDDSASESEAKKRWHHSQNAEAQSRETTLANAQITDKCLTKIDMICENLKNDQMKNLKRAANFFENERVLENDVVSKGAKKRKMMKVFRHITETDVNPPSSEGKYNVEQCKLEQLTISKDEISLGEKEAEKSANSEKLPPRKTLSPKLSLSSYVNKQEAKKQLNKNNREISINDVKENNPIFASLLCKEPPLEETFSDEEDMKIHENRNASLRKFQQTEKILKGRISLLSPRRKLRHLPSLRQACLKSTDRLAIVGLKYNGVVTNRVVKLKSFFISKDSLTASNRSQNILTVNSSTDVSTQVSGLKQVTNFKDKKILKDCKSSDATVSIPNDKSNGHMQENKTESILQTKSAAPICNMEQYSFVCRNENLASFQKQDDLIARKNNALNVERPMLADVVKDFKLCKELAENNTEELACEDKHKTPIAIEDTSCSLPNLTEHRIIPDGTIPNTVCQNSDKNICAGQMQVSNRKLTKIRTETEERQISNSQARITPFASISHCSLEQKNSDQNISAQSIDFVDSIERKYAEDVQNISNSQNHRSHSCKLESSRNKILQESTKDTSRMSNGNYGSKTKESYRLSMDEVDNYVKSRFPFNPMEFSRTSFQRLLQSAKSERMKRIQTKMPECEAERNTNAPKQTYSENASIDTAADSGGKTPDETDMLLPKDDKVVKNASFTGSADKIASPASTNDSECKKKGNGKLAHERTSSDTSCYHLKQRLENMDLALYVALKYVNRKFVASNTKRNADTTSSSGCASYKDNPLRVALRNVCKTDDENGAQQTPSSPPKKERYHKCKFKSKMRNIKPSSETSSGLINIEKDLRSLNFSIESFIRNKVDEQSQQHQDHQHDKAKTTDVETFPTLNTHTQVTSTEEVDLCCYEESIRMDSPVETNDCGIRPKVQRPSSLRGNAMTSSSIRVNLSVDDAFNTNDDMLLSGPLKFEKQYKEPFAQHRGKTGRGRSRSIRLRNLQYHKSLDDSSSRSNTINVCKEKNSSFKSIHRETESARTSNKFAKSENLIPGSNKMNDNSPGNGKSEYSIEATESLLTGMKIQGLGTECEMHLPKAAVAREEERSPNLHSTASRGISQSGNKEGIANNDVCNHVTRESVKQSTVDVYESRVRKITRYPRRCRRMPQKFYKDFHTDMSFTNPTYSRLTDIENFCSVQYSKQAVATAQIPDVARDTTQQLLDEMLELNKNLLSHKQGTIKNI